MIKRGIIIALMAYVGVAGVCLPDTRQALVEINAIKSNPEYIYAEATTSDAKTSYNNAMDLLETYLEDWLKSNCDSTEISGCVTKASKNILQIETKRGSLFRAFLYVKKSDVLTYASDKDLVVVPLGDSKKLQPAELQDVSNESVTNEQYVPAQGLTSHAYHPDAFGEKMLEVGTFDGIEPFVKQNSNGSMGKYKTMPNEGCCYIFVYNRSGEVVSHLLFNNGSWTNIRTGKADNIKNYPGCGAIWFQKK